MTERISGTVRFSVESLLYYAPKITATGMAQRRLLGLGDFFGNSWPDQPFRDSYPRSQYAMLIMARQLADEIQGIGGGIRQMAQTYGITENQNTADINKIQTEEGQISALMAHTGGPASPPDTPLKDPYARPGGDQVPDPRANSAPAVPAPRPPGSPAPEPGTKPTATPSPRPQAPLGPHTVRWGPFDIRELAGPFPSGDPTRMEEAADCWRDLNAALDEAWSDLQRYTAYILSDAEGPAADAFRDYADGLIAPGHGSLTHAIKTCIYLRDSCLDQAAEIRNLRRTLEQTADELAAGFVIGQFVSVLTFQTTQALSDAIDAGIMAKFTSLAEWFEEHGMTFMRELETTVKAASKVFSKAFVAGAQGSVIGGLDFAANDLIGRAFDEPWASGTTALKDIAEGGVLGSIGSLVGQSAGAASKKLIKMGQALQNSEDGDSQAGARLMALGRQLKEGSITVAAASAAMGQLIVQHQITPATFFASTIGSRFTTMISPHTGAHVAD
ncbi:MAG: hypothetical protein J2P25_13505 [Nocardiopsaceae bacterium]|nr:hypothetical protein [Nocardiopsaceae bacterium]